MLPWAALLFLVERSVTLEVKYVRLPYHDGLTRVWHLKLNTFSLSIHSCLQNNISWMLIRRQAPCQTLGTGHTIVL